jgi:metal-responsive CopG/Arc/MetJ family transcriptional regulator
MAAMATVNFSVPDDVKKAFDRTFKKQNKSAIIADLMRRAVAEAEFQQRRKRIFREITEDRKNKPRVTDEQIRKAREAGRP